MIKYKPRVMTLPTLINIPTIKCSIQAITISIYKNSIRITRKIANTRIKFTLANI